MTTPRNNKFKPNLELSSQDTHTENTSNQYITTTEDKIRLCASDLKRGLESRFSWFVPFLFIISTVLTLVTASFNEKFGVSSHIWESTYYAIIIFAALWLIKNLVSLIFNFKKGNIDNFIKSLRGD